MDQGESVPENHSSTAQMSSRPDLKLKGLLRRVTSLRSTRNNNNDDDDNTLPSPQILPASPNQTAASSSAPVASSATNADIPRVCAQLAAGGELTQYPVASSFPFVLKFWSNAYAAQLLALETAAKATLLYAELLERPGPRDRTSSFHAVRDLLEANVQTFEFDNRIEIQLLPLMPTTDLQRDTVDESQWVDLHGFAFLQSLQRSSARHMAAVCRWKHGRIARNPQLAP